MYFERPIIQHADLYKETDCCRTILYDTKLMLVHFSNFDLL